MFRKAIAIFVVWTGALAADPNFVLDLENDPAALIEGRVNALTGRFALHEEDLVIQGAEPIRISRTYIDDTEGSWRFTVDFARILDLCVKSNGLRNSSFRISQGVVGFFSYFPQWQSTICTSTGLFFNGFYPRYLLL